MQLLFFLFSPPFSPPAVVVNEIKCSYETTGRRRNLGTVQFMCYAESRTLTVILQPKSEEIWQSLLLWKIDKISTGVNW